MSDNEELADMCQRIARLEVLVDVLARLAGVTVEVCENEKCDFGDGFWPDGEPCGYCRGTRMKVVEPT